MVRALLTRITSKNYIKLYKLEKIVSLSELRMIKKTLAENKVATEACSKCSPLKGNGIKLCARSNSAGHVSNQGALFVSVLHDNKLLRVKSDRVQQNGLKAGDRRIADETINLG